MSFVTWVLRCSCFFHLNNYRRFAIKFHTFRVCVSQFRSYIGFFSINIKCILCVTTSDFKAVGTALGHATDDCAKIKANKRTFRNGLAGFQSHAKVPTVVYHERVVERIRESWFVVFRNFVEKLHFLALKTIPVLFIAVAKIFGTIRTPSAASFVCWAFPVKWTILERATGSCEWSLSK